MNQSWNPELYQSSHSFVWEYGRELLALLEPTPGERILDVGCGSGQLTAEIAASGAQILGIDSSAEMVEKARANFPDLRFEVQDVCDMPYRGDFDALFSNAALHWVRRSDDAARALARALKPGGRLVAELGGSGNIQALIEAATLAMASLEIEQAERFDRWFFPSIGEYASLLERHGLEVTFATLFDRRAPLEGGAEGLANWMRMFGGHMFEELDADRQRELLRLVEENAAPHLFQDGQWVADYRRLRITAIRRG